MEDFVTDFEIIRERFNKLLSIPVEKRSDDDLFQLMRLTSSLVIFEHCKMSEIHKEVCKHIVVKEYPKGTIIFKQGVEADGYYYVLKGCVDVYAYDVDSNTGKTKLSYITTVLPGSGFGELALMYECPRSGSAIASNNTELMIIRKRIYDKFVKDIHEKTLFDLVKFFYSIPILKKEPISNILKYSLKCSRQKIGTKDIVLKYNEYVNDFVFVKYPIKVNKLILKNIHKYTEDRFIEELKEMQKSNNNDLNEEIIDIMEFTDKDIIGEYYATNIKKIDVFLIPHLPTDIVTINAEFINQINPKLYSAIKKYSAPIFEDDRVFRKLYRNLMWKSDKRSLLSNIKKK